MLEYRAQAKPPSLRPGTIPRFCGVQINTNIRLHSEQMWELSSFSEAAKASGQAMKISAVPAP
ncbi:hypothetical protein, partial [Pseudomonas kilonensis]